MILKYFERKIINFSFVLMTWLVYISFDTIVITVYTYKLDLMLDCKIVGVGWQGNVSTLKKTTYRIEKTGDVYTMNRLQSPSLRNRKFII